MEVTSTPRQPRRPLAGDEQLDEWKPLLIAWWSRFGDEPVTVNDLRVALCLDTPHDTLSIPSSLRRPRRLPHSLAGRLVRSWCAPPARIRTSMFACGACSASSQVRNREPTNDTFSTNTTIRHVAPRWPPFAPHPPTATTIPLRHRSRLAATRWPTARLPKWQSERPAASRPMVPSRRKLAGEARGNSRQPSESLFRLSERQMEITHVLTNTTS